MRWTDEETGRERDKKFPPVKTKTEADKLVEDFKSDLKGHGGKIVDSAKVKFSLEGVLETSVAISENAAWL